MKRLLLFAVIMLSMLPAIAQIKSANLQASGLTCAMCAKSVYKNLESLSFVDKIDTDLEKSAFLLSFKAGVPVDADQIRKKVEDAGFSVASLTFKAQFADQTIQADQHLTIDGSVYHFVGIPSQSLNGEKQFSLVDKVFLTPKDFKKYAQVSKMECFKTGQAGSCCTKDGIAPATRIYHVTLVP